MKPVVTVGWILLDILAETAALPAPGRGATASDFDVAAAGRAANQAMALTAIEVEVALIARCGSDSHASLLQDELLELGVNSEAVTAVNTATGVRMSAEQPDGQRISIVYPGANDHLSVDDLNRRGELLRGASAVGVTTEPAGAVSLRAMEIARGAKIPTVLTHNAGSEVSERVLAAADVVVVSDTTSLGLLDPKVARDQPDHAARALCQRGARAVALLTPDRAVLATPEGAHMLPSPSPLDSEDAVDAFAAGLLDGLARGEDLKKAFTRGVRVSCLLID